MRSSASPKIPARPSLGGQRLERIVGFLAGNAGKIDGGVGTQV